jgi:predicted membrane-bound spermidine synthase
MSRDLALALKLAAAALLCAELLSLTGVLAPPHRELWVSLRAGHALHDIGSLALHFALMFACARPGRRALIQVLVWGSALNAIAVWIKPLGGASFWYWINTLGFGYGLASLAVLGNWARCAEARQRYLGRQLLGAAAVLALYSYAIPWYLSLTAVLHPATYDFIAYRIDGTLGFQPSVAAALLAQLIPFAPQTLGATYVLLPYGFSLLYALQLAQQRPAPASLFVIFTMSAALALLLYQLCPISGPRYAFGGAFPLATPDAAALPLAATLVQPAARNGMPSWHVGWALILWLNAWHAPRAVRAGFALFFALTVLATLATGEHYLVDLVAVFPAAVAVQAACNRHLAWNDPQRWRAIAAGATLTLAWIAAVRYGASAFVEIPGLTWAVVLATPIAAARIYARFARAAQAALPLAPTPSVATSSPSSTSAASSRALRPVWVMFVVSGFAGLVYEVLFSKVLALTFGSQATATYTVLATYMGGMALGAWLGGWWAQRRADALRLYGWCELGIGAYCLATPLVFAGIQALYVGLAQGLAADAPGLVGLRVGLGVVGLAVPTVLMGATLPILARYAQGRAVSLGVSVGLLYGANTVGAALGALLGGYLIIPLLGVWKTTLAAAGLNFAVAWLALRLARGAPPQALPQGGCEPARVAAPPAVPGRRVRALGGLALVVLAVGGVVTLALEVNYIHLLAVVAGNSVYAFSLMLFAFLLGLGGGAEIARRLLKFGLDPAWALAWLQFALAGLVLGGVFLWEGLPRYFASFEGYPLHYGFGARELVRALVCLVALLPPALLIGMIYPVAMECVGRAAPQAAIAALGRAAALNTAGNIAGVLVAGFVLLPQLGALRSIQLLAGLSAALGVLIVVVAGLAARPLAWVPAVLVLALAAVQPHAFDYTALASGANVYFRAQPYGRVIAAAESADGGLTTVAEQHVPGRGRLLTLLTNGKFQGSNDPQGEVVAQIGIALAPLLHTAARERALVIGYGTGTSARVFKEAGFRALDIVELSADIVRLADTHFAEINARVSTQAGVNTYLTDGRNFLLLQPRTYDVVSLEVSSIWFAGAAALYNREFYQLVKRRLAPHGVLQQWVQLHHIYPADLLTVLGTVRAEFSYVWLYLVGGQGIIVATNDPASAPHPAHLQALERTSALAPLLAQLPGGAAGVLAARLLEPAATERLLARFGLPLSAWVSTDDNLRLEYSTPKGNALDGLHSLRQNIEWLVAHAGTSEP